jgi:hypothetical protein
MTTLGRIDTIKKSTTANPPEMDPGDQKRHVELLESDLRLHAKVIAFKLGVAHSESTILAMANSDGAANDSSRVALYDLESSMKTVLSKDKKFMQLLKAVQVDFANGYKELVESN